MPDTVFVTLGPHGTNHDWVLRQYIAERGVRADILHVEEASQMLPLCASGNATHIFVCAAHPLSGALVAGAQYRHGILLCDTFIAESQPLAILSKNDKPRSIALHPATRDYTDLAAFEDVIDAPSTVAAFSGMIHGKWDAALTLRRFAQEDGITMVREIAAPRDAWLVLTAPSGRTLLGQ